MAAQVLGAGLDHQVCSELDGPAQVGRCERVVDDDRGRVPVAQIGQGRDVGDDDGRVGDGLQIEQARRCLGECSLDRLEIGGIDEVRPDAQPSQNPRQQ